MDTLLTTDPAAPRRVTTTVDNSLVRFNGVVGQQQGTGIIVDDSNNVTGVVGLTATGTATLSTVDINAGAIDGTTIGATTASSVKATTINATGATTLTTVDLTGAATVDIINEHTSASGVTVEGILVKDSIISGGFNKLNHAFAGIHVHDASTAQSIPTGATYTKSTCFTDNDTAYNATPDAANDKITINTTGVYKIDHTVSFTTGTNAVVIFIAPFLGGTEVDSVHISRKIGTGSDVGSAGFSGLINVTSVPVDLDMRIRHDDGGSVNVTISYCNMSIIRVGDAQ